MANPAKSDDVVLLDASAMTAAKPQGPHCATCPHFSDTSTEAQRVKRQAIGGVHRADCRLEPVVVNKTPDDVCGQHPEMLARQTAATFGPLIEKLGQIIGQAQGARR